MKKITSKRVKTDADYEEMSRIEFMAGLYMSKDGPVIPSKCFNAMTIAAAKKSKEGQSAKSAVFCDNYAVLEYDGPRADDELFQRDEFRSTEKVRVGMSSVQRTRPVFNKWTCIVTFNIDSALVNPSRLDEWMVVAGTQIGLGDWRPQYGRFSVERVE